VNKDWSDYGSTEGEYTEINSAVSVKIRGIWNDKMKEWIYNCYLCGGGAVRTDPDEPEREGWGCFNHYIKIKEQENEENFYLDIDQNRPERMGCTPHSGEEEDYSTIENILEASVNVMINLMGSYVSFAWTIAAPFIDDLVSGMDVWDGYAVEHSWTPTINAPPPFPGDFPAAKRVEYGIQEITVSEIKEHDREFSLSSAAVDELVNLGEPVYIVTDGIVIEKHPTRVFKTDLASYKAEFDRRANND
jgi:hypothetical protein